MFDDQENQRLFTQSKSPNKASPSAQDNCPFHCHECSMMAEAPVVNECGHIFCWKCIIQKRNKRSLQCNTCSRSLFIDTMRPLFINQESELNLKQGTSLEIRPKPKFSTPLQNIEKVSNLIDPATRENNVERGKNLAGVSNLPSTFVLSFSTFSDSESIMEEHPIEKQVSKFSRKLQICLSVSILILIFGVLFLVDRA